nr:MAG TPA_asm: hypothetical protein [Caudoviricetes sp.]
MIDILLVCPRPMLGIFILSECFYPDLHGI